MPPIENFREPVRNSESSAINFTAYEPNNSSSTPKRATGYTRANAAEDAEYMKKGWITNAVIVDGSGADVANRGSSMMDELHRGNRRDGRSNRADGTELGPKNDRTGLPNVTDGTELGPKNHKTGLPNRADGTELGPKNHQTGLPNRADGTELGPKNHQNGLPNRAGGVEIGQRKDGTELGLKNDRPVPKNQMRIGPDNKVDTFDSIKESIRDVVRYFGQ
jgi:hypothetical protein